MEYDIPARSYKEQTGLDIGPEILQKIWYAIQFSDLKVIYNVDMSKYEWVYI